MTAIVDRYRSCTYPTEVDAHAAAETLEQFGLHPLGPFELRAVTIGVAGGVMVTWEVVCVIPEKGSQRDPLDLDPAVDGIESHWDREHDDREINSRRHDH